MDDFVSLLTSIFLNQLRTNKFKINCSSIFLLRLKYLHPKGFLEYFVPGFISSSLLQRQIIPILRPTSIVSSHPFRCKGSWKRFSMRSKKEDMVTWRQMFCLEKWWMDLTSPTRALPPSISTGLSLPSITFVIHQVEKKIGQEEKKTCVIYWTK